MAELGPTEFGWDIGWPTLTELYAAWLGWDWLGLSELGSAGFAWLFLDWATLG